MDLDFARSGSATRSLRPLQQQTTMFSSPSSRKDSSQPHPATALFANALSVGLEPHLDNMTVLQRQKALLRVNKVADSCFRECCTDFGLTKYLGNGEEACIERCVDKYVQLSACVGQSFVDTLIGGTPSREKL